MVGQAERLRLVIIDDNRMRQAGMASLLNDWADQHNLDIKQIRGSSVLTEFEHTGTYRLVLYSVGGGTVRSGEAGGLIRVLNALAPHAPVVVISDRDDPEEILSAYHASCSGYIPTSMEPALALQAMGFILGGGSYFPPSALRLAAARRNAPSDGSESIDGEDEGNGPVELDGVNGSASLADEVVEEVVEEAPVERPVVVNSCAASNDDVTEGDSCSTTLTGRQLEVLECLQRGHPNKLIARELGLTEGTVKVHVRQIMRKLGATNRTQVAVLSASGTGVSFHLHARRRGVGIQ